MCACGCLYCPRCRHHGPQSSPARVDTDAPRQRDKNGRFTRTPRTFAQRVEAEVWADLESQTRALTDARTLTYQERAIFLTVAIDTAAERLEWLGVPA